MRKRLVKEPLVHFLALAAVVFGVHGLLDRSAPSKPDEIVITGSRVDQLAALFSRTWQRPPTGPELKGLIDDYVKEEILVREALTLGLDKNDTVIRRRLRSKMEFLGDAENAPTPTEAELSEYLQLNPDKFEIEPRFAFEQIFLNRDRRAGKFDRDVVELLETLRTKASIDPKELGDATLLPLRLESTGKASIDRIFGADFAGALDKIAPGQWAGPVESAFGLHLVRVSERETARRPALDEVRAVVEREWTSEKRKALEDRRLAALLARYKITIDDNSKAPPRPAAGQ